jgi:lysine-specific demethylase 8
MDDTMRRAVSDLALVSKSEGTTHWDASKRVEVSSLTTASFYEAYVKKNRPVVIKGLLEKDQWSAVETFCDLKWLHDTYGDTPVPVEALSVDHCDNSHGSHETRYGEKNDGKGSVSVAYATLSSFLESYFAEPSPTEPLTDRDGQNENLKVAYVSQHSLLHQCPTLQHHFAVPEFCLGRLSAANAWLGTANTKTHLHTDDADNLLCQVAGHKLVKLFPPSVTPYVYQDSVDDRKTGNKSVNAFSPVDCEDVAEQKRVFPLFKKARDEEIQTVIGPGETLFVPRGWWHYVRALEPSFSVNFWF